MRTVVQLTTNTKSRHTLARLFQAGGALPHYVHGGTGFFGNLWGGIKRAAVPVFKSVAKEALPIATQAISAVLGAKGSLKDSARAGFQSTGTKQNLLRLGRAVAAAALRRALSNLDEQRYPYQAMLLTLLSKNKNWGDSGASQLEGWYPDTPETFEAKDDTNKGFVARQALISAAANTDPAHIVTRSRLRCCYKTYVFAAQTY